MKTLGYILLILAIAVAAVVLWPAPNPLKGVETVALEDVPEPVTILINDSVITLGDNTFTITNDASQADAVIIFHDVTGVSGSFEISEQGVKASAHVVLEVEKNGEHTIMDLYIDLNNDNVSARLEGRKFYEVWKYTSTQQ